MSGSACRELQLIVMFGACELLAACELTALPGSYRDRFVVALEG
jgi:hypothetical protein